MAIRKGDRIKKLREALLRRRRELLGDLDRITKETQRGDRMTRGGDVVDRAHSDAWIEQASMIAESDQMELAAIEEALEKMEEGDYGRCQNCGRSIPVARLRILPTAVYCVSCRSEFDRGSVNRTADRRGPMPDVEDEDSSGRREVTVDSEAPGILGDDVHSLTEN